MNHSPWGQFTILSKGVQVISFPLSYWLHPLPAKTSVHITDIYFTTAEYDLLLRNLFFYHKAFTLRHHLQSFTFAHTTDESRQWPNTQWQRSLFIEKASTAVRFWVWSSRYLVWWFLTLHQELNWWVSHTYIRNKYVFHRPPRTLLSHYSYSLHCLMSHHSLASLPSCFLSRSESIDGKAWTRYLFSIFLIKSCHLALFNSKGL